MPTSCESYVHEALSDHFSEVTKAIDRLDAVIGVAYNETLAHSDTPDIETAQLDPFETGPGYIDKSTGYYISQRSGDVGDTNMVIEQNPRRAIDYSFVSEDLHLAYHRLAGTASSEGIALDRLRNVFETAYPDESPDKLASRRPLYVWRLTPDENSDTRTKYAGDVVALPEIVNPEITKRIGEQVVIAEHVIGLMADNTEVTEQLKAFESVGHVLSRAHDSHKVEFAPLRMYKEGILTAAQSISFLSEGITDEADFRDALSRWKEEKTFETIASCMPGAIIGPLAVRGAQPLAGLIRSASGEMRPELKTGLQTISRERKQKWVQQGTSLVQRSGIPNDDLNRADRSEIPNALFGDRSNFFLPNWGCLASASVIRRATNIALASLK